MRNNYQPVHLEWIKNNYLKYVDDLSFNTDKLIKDFYKKFNIVLTKSKIYNLLYVKLKLKQNKKHNRMQREDYEPYNKHPIGSELFNSGVWYVKVKDEPIKKGEFRRKNYQRKERYLYEKYHNVKLTDKDYIIFLNGDKNDFSKENLYKIHHKVLGKLNGNKFYNIEDPVIRLASIKVCETEYLIENNLKEVLENER